MTERNDFEVESAPAVIKLPFNHPYIKTIELQRMSRNVPDRTGIYAKEGLCAANLDNKDQPRDREWCLANVIAPMIERGEIDNKTKTPFDDRKLRYDGSQLFYAPNNCEGDLVVKFGVTHFPAFQADLNRSDEDNLKLQERGVQDFRDKWAYFSRAPGVAVLPINKDRTIFIGERANKEYGGFLNAVAGHLTYKDDVKQVDVPGEALRELQEEFGIQLGEVSNLRFVGLYSHPIKGDLDFTFLADVAKPEQYFASGEWKESVKEREHKDLVRLATMGEIHELLETGKVPGSDRTLQVMYSTRGALRSVYANEIRN